MKKTTKKLAKIKEHEIVLFNLKEDVLDEEELDQSLANHDIEDTDLRQRIIEKVQGQIKKGKDCELRFTVRITNRLPHGWYIRRKLAENVTYYAASPVSVYIVIR